MATKKKRGKTMLNFSKNLQHSMAMRMNNKCPKVISLYLQSIFPRDPQVCSSCMVVISTGILLVRLLMWYIFKYLKCLLNLRLCSRKLQPHHPLVGEVTDVVNFNDLKDKKIMLIYRDRSKDSIPLLFRDSARDKLNNLGIRNPQVELQLSYQLVICY